MARLILDQREDQQLGAAFLQLAIEHPRLDMLHSDILLKSISRVKSGGGAGALRARCRVQVLRRWCKVLVRYDFASSERDRSKPSERIRREISRGVGEFGQESGRQEIRSILVH